MLTGCSRPLARLAVCLSRQSACASSFSTSSLLKSGLEQVGPAEAAKEQRAQEGDTDYNATPQYPNKTPAEGSAGEAAMAASRAPHPSGPMDTSSVNDPSGRATGSSSYQEQQGADASQRSAHSMHVHHPGREAEVADLQNRSNSSSSGVQQGSAGPDAAAESASAAASSGGGGFDGVEGGPEAANILPRSERATTADFAAGGDDVSPPAEGSAPVNPDTGLPHMPDAASAGADCGRFGQLKQPGEVREQGMTARQTEKSTGMDPGGHGSS